MRQHRREFLGTMAVAGGLVGALPGVLTAAGGRTAVSTGPWDLAWLDDIKGKHRQLFDLGAIDGDPLHVVHNWLRAHHEVFNLTAPDVSTVVGIAFNAFPINANDHLWEKYGVGEKWKVHDPSTHATATHNIFAGDPGSSEEEGTVASLRARGTQFWQCNNALNGISHWFAESSGGKFEDVREELIANLMPGTHLVPAHTMLVGLCQEHGCAYEKL